MMLNQSGVNVEKANSQTSILASIQHFYSLSCKVDATGVTADEDGKKILKAGTPLKGDITKRDETFTKATDSTGLAGILLHDVDVTGTGTRNAQFVMFGFIDLTKVDDATAALITDEVKSALNMIKFVK